MVVGRIFSGAIAEKFNYNRFLVTSTLGVILFLVGMALVKNTILAFIIVLMLGLCLSGIFAVVLVFALLMLVFLHQNRKRHSYLEIKESDLV
ncbi:hypothetical protein ASF12_16750 [Paenibacillus sp. Leaf72]|nr:hypothetical protein ASF12_16750 [Paenibacillus sp. Leaf72]